MITMSICLVLEGNIPLFLGNFQKGFGLWFNIMLPSLFSGFRCNLVSMRATCSLDELLSVYKKNLNKFFLPFSLFTNDDPKERL
jgi:hypothetical protein